MTFTAVDAVVLALSSISLVVWAVWILRHRSQALYAVPPITWSLNVALFYATLPLQTDPMMHLIWSDVLRLHVAFLLFGVGLVMLLERFVVRGHIKR